MVLKPDGSTENGNEGTDVKETLGNRAIPGYIKHLLAQSSMVSSPNTRVSKTFTKSTLPCAVHEPLDCSPLLIDTVLNN